MATKKQTMQQEDSSISEEAPISVEIVGDGTGEALPVVSQESSETPTAPLEPEVPADPAPSPESDSETFTARVLCSTTLGGTRYQPNDVIEGVPADVLAQYAGSLDPNPDAVAFAMAEGGTTHQFKD